MTFITHDNSPVKKHGLPKGIKPAKLFMLYSAGDDATSYKGNQLSCIIHLAKDKEA
jgi:hypothetical protein